MTSSHPESPNFGQHWTEEQVHDMFAPSEESVREVRNWLVSSGIEATMIVHSDNKGWLALDIPAWKAEELFQAKYHEVGILQDLFPLFDYLRAVETPVSSFRQFSVFPNQKLPEVKC